MSAAAPRLILHLGQHKTGSKALQSSLAVHADRLQARGVLYPRLAPAGRASHAQAVSHHRLFVAVRHAAMRAHGDAAAADRFRSAEGCDEGHSPEESFAQLDAARRRAGATALLLSAEDLFDLHTCHELTFAPAYAAHAARLLAALAGTHGYATRLIVYVRRQDHLLAAHYAQFVKGAPEGDLDFATFAERFAPRLRTSERLQPWVDAFGAAAIVLRPYEREQLPGGIVPDFLRLLLGAPPVPAWPAPPRDRESANVTPDHEHLECIRLLRRRRTSSPSRPGRVVSDTRIAANPTLRTKKRRRCSYSQIVFAARATTTGRRRSTSCGAR